MDSCSGVHIHKLMFLFHQIPLASAPPHVLTNSSAFAKQKLLETIQSKQQLHTSGILGDALKDVSEVGEHCALHVYCTIQPIHDAVLMLTLQ